MEGIEEDVMKLLNGGVVSIVDVDSGHDKSKFTPKTKETVGFIVSAVVINEAGQVLMIQEAKYSCHGTWYLPAGRVEKKENLLEAVKREVKEEAGLEIEPVTLISVEFGAGTWMRFNFAGKITGGVLKTLDYQDKESLQAEWIDRKHLKDGTLKIRAKDIFEPIGLGYTYYEKPPRLRHPDILPSQVPHTKMIHRPMIVCITEDSKVHILTNTKDSPHLPSCYIGPSDSSSRTSIYTILKEANMEGKQGESISIAGILSVEYNGDPDTNINGLCLTTLVKFTCPKPPKIKNKFYSWHCASSDLQENILTRIKEEKFVRFIDLY